MRRAQLTRAAIPLVAGLGAAAIWNRARKPVRIGTPPLAADLSRPGPRPRVVVLGGGFGGLSAALSLARAHHDHRDLEIVLVDRQNYHTFTPLLYQVAVGVIDPMSITYPLRAIAHRAGLRFVLGEAQDFDLAGQRVITSVGPITYDYLVVALGSVTNFYGQAEIERRALPLKTISDATAIRNAVLASLECAEAATDPAQRQGPLTFPIVGGGPTGLELAGALAALIGDVAGREYPSIQARDVSIEVFEAASDVLPGMSPPMRQLARDRLAERGVHIRLNAPLTGVADGAYLIGDGDRLSADTLVWAAGVRPPPVTQGLPGDRTRDGRVIVDESLHLPGHPEVFVIGDDAAMLAGSERAPLPATAPAAIQAGSSVARSLQAQLHGASPHVFRYRHPGNLVALGRHAAAAEVKGVTFDGWPAWLLWRAIHLMWLTGLHNRAQVLLDWSLLYLAPRQTEWIRDTRTDERFIRHSERPAA